ncbi:hypothetical protein GCM10017673_53220 [Streptosporangium violaceochromogenes]|nr:hypothetical protein GCM10017673_53220 [Streptosporangium violaceochromogenes]
MPKGLLLALLLTPNAWVTRSAVITLLWDEPPKSAEANLRTHVAVVRRWLSSHSLENRLSTVRSGTRQGGVYRISATDAEVDALLFVQLLEAGRRLLRSGHVEAAAGKLAQAESLWRGAAGADGQGAERLQAKLNLLDELRLEASCLLTETMILRDDLRPLGHRIERLLTDHPLQERFWEQLLRVHYLVGDTARALETYQRASSTLRKELDVAPGPSLQRLHRAVLSRDEEMLRCPGQVLVGADRN